jgi:hypothetical protein
VGTPATTVDAPEPAAEPAAEPAVGRARETAEAPPDEDAIREWRRLRDAVRREDVVRRNRGYVDGTLDKLGIRLSKVQREKIHAAFAAFGPRRDEIWGEAKARAQQTMAAGGTIDRAEFVAETVTVIQGEFAETIAGTVPPSDAQRISRALNPGK